MVQKICTGSRELIATNETSVIAKPFLNAVVMEDSQGDGGLPDAARAYESDRI